MTARTLHVHLSREAAARLDGDSNAAGQTLRDWLLDAFERRIEPCLAHASLFSTSIEVAPDVPLLIEAYTRIAACTPEELIEAWLMEPPAADGAVKRARVAATPAAAPTLSGETLGKVAQVLDMGETLLEAFAADARRKLGGTYPEGDKAAQTMSEIFRALRVTIGLQQPASQPAARGDVGVTPIHIEPTPHE
ncbi:MAG TPA: hypothetical protein VEY11_17470 [Pyrinomonadaceae bacterium]|nr:hypothetical protein [Pyrinomonadaceae bacterium]